MNKPKIQKQVAICLLLLASLTLTGCDFLNAVGELMVIYQLNAFTQKPRKALSEEEKARMLEELRQSGEKAQPQAATVPDAATKETVPVYPPDEEPMID